MRSDQETLNKVWVENNYRIKKVVEELDLKPKLFENIKGSLTEINRNMRSVYVPPMAVFGHFLGSIDKAVRAEERGFPRSYLELKKYFYSYAQICILFYKCVAEILSKKANQGNRESWNDLIKDSQNFSSIAELYEPSLEFESFTPKSDQQQTLINNYLMLVKIYLFNLKNPRNNSEIRTNSKAFINSILHPNRHFPDINHHLVASFILNLRENEIKDINLYMKLESNNLQFRNLQENLIFSIHRKSLYSYLHEIIMSESITNKLRVRKLWLSKIREHNLSNNYKI